MSRFPSFSSMRGGGGVCLAAMSIALGPLAGWGSGITVLALSGEPVAAGEAGTVFDTFSDPVVNAAGEVAIHAVLRNPDWVPATRAALFVYRPDSGLTELVRAGPSTAAPPFGISSFRDTSTGNGARVPSFSDRGTLVTTAVVDTPGVTFPVGLFRIHPEEGLLRIFRNGDPSPTGAGVIVSWTQQVQNAHDQIAIQVQNQPAVGASYSSLERIEPDGSVTRLAYTGMAIGDEGATLVGLFNNPALNASGQVAIGGRLRLADDSLVVAVLLFGAGGPRVVARAGDPSPDGDGVYGSSSPFFSGLKLNDRGQILFQIRMADASVSQLHHAWVLVDGETSTVLLRERHANPAGGGVFDPVVEMQWNNPGQGAFMAPLSGAFGGLFQAAPDGLRLVYRGNDPAPGGIGFYREPSSATSGSRSVALNDRGDTAFVGNFSLPNPSGVGIIAARMLVYRDAHGRLFEVMRVGAELEGSTVTALGFYDADPAAGPRGGQRSALGAGGHVAFSARLQDGRTGVFLWSSPAARGFAGAAGADCLAGAWCELPWYGAFYQAGDWLQHEVHGWQFFGTVAEGRVALFDLEIGAWLWLDAAAYPFLFVGAPLDSWVAFDPDSPPGERRFFRFDTGEWRNAGNLVD